MDQRERLQRALGSRYVLERELGRGGMATVYLARDLPHDRPVALKLLHPDLARSLGAERFLREIRTAARLQHPHILSVYDSGAASEDGAERLWFTMPYVEGETLRDRLRREPQLPVEEALRIAREVADGLDYAHRHGVIHRDVKPENILLSESHAMVADFGVSRAMAVNGDERLTESGVAIGTPAYMSPEQASGEPVDARTDVYALGAVLYEMLAGEPPFTGPTVQAVIAKRFHTEPTPIRAVRPAVPVPVERALARALARVPADRFATTAELARALAQPGPAAGERGARRSRGERGSAVRVWHADLAPEGERAIRRTSLWPVYASRSLRGARVQQQFPISRRAAVAALAGTAVAAALRPLHALARAVPHTKPIPSSGERIPVVGLGTWITFNVGDDPELRAECTAVMRAFFQEGGRMIDSSPMYGSSQPVIGHGLARLGRPEALFSAEKVWTSSGSGGPEQIEASRAHWGVPRFDLLQVHNLLAWEKHLPLLLAMKAEGRVRYVGITTSEGRRHDEIERIMASRPIDFVQVTYNALDREIETRILPLARDRGIAVIANRPFREGALIRQVERHPLPAWAAEAGAANWAQFLLKFIVSHPDVTCAIPATSRVDHVLENMGAAAGPLPDAALRRRMAAHVAEL